MPQHHSQDYKITAVKHYLNKTKNYTKTCKEFNCSRISLMRWVRKYKKDKTIKRYNRKPISYKITKNQVDYALKILDKNQQITMKELHKQVKKKYPKLDISVRQLNNIIRDNNKTRKRTRHQHFPKTRYNKPINKQKELKKFYQEIDKYKIDKIISLDETSIKPSMIPEYSRCDIGERCVYKTNDSYIFRSFTLLMAINNKGCVGYTLYEKGGMTKERLKEFIDKFIKGKYKNNLIILDNAGSHNNNLIKDTIKDTGNNYLYSIPYTPNTNGTIEASFNQVKHYLKLNKKVLKFNELKKEVKKAIENIKLKNYKNYFNYFYKNKTIRKYTKKNSTKKKKLKNYKIDK